MIQRFIQSDYSPLIDIWEKSVAGTHDFLSKENYDIIHSKLPEYFKNVALYVYKKSSEIIGFMGVHEDKLEMLFIHPDYFRRGIGSFMVKYAIKFLHIKYIDVNEQNLVAIEFYKSLGFIVIGTQEKDEFGYSLLHLMYNGSK